MTGAPPSSSGMLAHRPALRPGILLSPPLHRTTEEELRRWNGSAAPIVAVIPEHDDYLKPDQAAERFAVLPRLRRVDVAGGRHLWVGESQTRRVLDEIVAAVNPSALPLPTTWPPTPSAPTAGTRSTT